MAPRKKAEPKKKTAPPKKPAAKATKAVAKKTPSKTAVAKVTPSRLEPSGYQGARSGNLIIVESPSKAKTIEKYLGSGYRVRASYGHVRDLPISGKLRNEEVVGIDINSNWELRYQVIDRSDTGGKGRRSTQDILQELQRESDRAEHIYLATDPDREGESIAWHIEEALGLDPERTKRITFNEITKKAVLKALQDARAIDDNLVAAQEARRALDRLVGYPLSNLLGKKVSRGLSAGRVQSVAVRMVVEREREIEAFQSEEYWKILALLSPMEAAKLQIGNQFPLKVYAKKKQESDDVDEDSESEDGEKSTAISKNEPVKEQRKGAFHPPEGYFIAELHQWDGASFKAASESEIDQYLSALDNANFKIATIEQKDRNDHAPPPFTTSTLQQQASTRLRFSAVRTMLNAQRLYEGVNMGSSGQVALITYMRTDSTRISEDAMKMVREHIEAVHGPAYLPAKPNYYKSGKSAQEAHEAIRPIDLAMTPERVQAYLDGDQFKLYKLIYDRFVASQMSAAIVAVTTIDIQAGQAIFRAKGQIEKFAGYRKVWPAGRQEDVTLPPVVARQDLLRHGLSATQHFTQPPSRYNEASLVKMLEKEGIGRPSTYATIISNITKKGYVELQDRRFFATELGKMVNDLLVAHFPQVLNLKFTSHFEEELDQVADGKMKFEAVLDEFWKPFKSALAAADSNMPVQKGQETGEPCPKCSRPLVRMYSSKRKGYFVGCSAWKDKENPCDYIKPQEGQADLALVEVHCPTCGQPMKQRSSRWGTFLSCTGYQADGSGCNTIANLGPNGEIVVTCKPTDEECPACHAKLLWRQGKAGPYFTCRNKECNNTIEAGPDGKPVPPIDTGMNCEKCGSKMIVKKSWRGPFLSCSGYPKCRNAKSVPAELKEKLKHLYPKKEKETEQLPEVEVKQTCPECGSAMKLRKARGNYFLGCTKYPKCKGTSQLTADLEEQLQQAEA
ncbi:MAG: type I DNA topoisomerase [Zavarzinella sp.]